MKKPTLFKSSICFLLAAISAIAPVQSTQAQAVLETGLPSQEIQFAQVSRSCNQAVENAIARLQQNRNISVSFQSFNLSEWYDEYPRNYPIGYSFYLSGRAGESVLRSPQFMTAISRDIIMTCEPVALVQFFLDQSDWYEAFGFMGDDRVILFECVEPGAPLSRRWGYRGCV